MTTHFLEHGMTACLHPVPASKWPIGETWTNKWDLVTCPECLKGQDKIETFTIDQEANSITCLRCKKTSFNPNDVTNKYCGNCHMYHESVWPPARLAWITHTDRNVISNDCPHCRKTLNGEVGMERQHPMKTDGDIVICAECGEPSVYKSNQLLKPSPEMMEKLSVDPQVMAAKEIISKRNKCKDRTAVFSSADSKYHDIAKLTFPVMQVWGSRHDYDVFMFNKSPNNLDPYWFGVGWGLCLLTMGYKRVICLDADQLITNLEIDFKDIPYSGFHASKDWGNDAIEPWHFSMCGFIAHSDCIPLFEHVLKMEPEWRDKPFPEQGPFRHVVMEMMQDLPHMRELMRGESHVGFINIHPRKKFNCVPDEVCPGNVPEPWKEGDFAAHITMLSIEQRIELIRKIAPVTLKQLNQRITNIV